MKITEGSVIETKVIDDKIAELKAKIKRIKRKLMYSRDRDKMNRYKAELAIYRSIKRQLLPIESTIKVAIEKAIESGYNDLWNSEYASSPEQYGEVFTTEQILEQINFSQKLEDKPMSTFTRDGY